MTSKIMIDLTEELSYQIFFQETTRTLKLSHTRLRKHE